MKNAYLSKILILSILLVVLASATAFGQVLNRPEPAPNPNIGATSPWTAACASESFNEYFVNFTWSPPLVDSNNEFILELSDANGDFNIPTELDRIADKNTTFDFDFIFSLATDVQGDGYRFRVRSTSPAITSPESDAFSMYYIGYDNPILISRNADGVIPSGGVIENCDNSSITLATHNVVNPEIYNYNWYRSGTLLSEKTNSITVIQAGIYVVEIDYGSNCSGSANTLSNSIEIRTGTSSGITISANSSTTLCAGQTVDLVASINDPSWIYTWYKNGMAITSPTLGDSSFTVDSSNANFDGDYTLQVEGNDICSEITNAIMINDAGDFTINLENDVNVVLLPSQIRTLSVSSSASSPIYQWYKDGSPIADATNTTLDISDVGVYFVRVTENGGSCVGNSIDSENITVVLPASFEFIISFTSSYISCESTSAILSLTQINAVGTDGTKTDVTVDLSADFSYQWTRGGVAVTGETSNSISLASAAENGDYTLQGNLDSFNPESNSTNVSLATGEAITINSTDLALCEGIDTITISADIDLSTETFTWTRNGSTVSTTDQVITISEAGTYELQVERTGCPIRSNQITITLFDESIITVDANENIIIQEGSSQTITASGASSYEWYNQDNIRISTTDSVSLSEEGTYLLIASIGSCTISRNFIVSFRDNFAIPNVITANGDGINDLWVLPNSFSGNPDITVVIYNENGEEVLNQPDYQNNWPQSFTSFTKPKTIFYYRLLNNTKILRQGTITVIR